MDGKKIGSKEGKSFLNLLLEKKKSWKKLFLNGSISPSRWTKEENAGQKMDDKTTGASIKKGSNDSPCASSVTDENGEGITSLGVVARLMGLDHVPTLAISETNPMPLPDSSSFEDIHSKRKASAAYNRKPVKLRSQKMPSNPIEKFRIETLPPKSTKRRLVAKHKLLPPIKNPSFASGRNAAQVMELATKIIRPRYLTSSTSKNSTGTYLSSSRVCTTRGSMAAPQKALMLKEAPRGFVLSSSVSSLRRKPVCGSLLNLQNPTALIVSDPLQFKGKLRPRQLAMQPKLNDQRSGLGVYQLNEFNKPSMNQSSNQKNSSQNRTTAKATNVLRQNNSKQNCLPKTDRFTSKSSALKQQGTKVISSKIRAIDKFSGSTGTGYRKESVESASSIRNTPQTKRLVLGRLCSEQRGLNEDTVRNENGKCIQRRIVMDEESRLVKNSRRNAVDVVSFTVNSRNKSLTKSRSMANVGEKDTESSYAETSSSNNSSTVMLNAIDGDYLGIILLEQKLRELTSGAKSPYRKPDKICSFAASKLIFEEPGSVFYSSGVEFVETGRESSGACMDEVCGAFCTDTAIDDDVCGTQYKETRRIDDIRKNEDSKELENRLFMSEASLSIESCNSSESVPNWIAVEALLNNIPGAEDVMGLSDSASSFDISSTCQIIACKEELSFVREILSKSICGDVSVYSLHQSGPVIDPLQFDEFEDDITSISSKGNQKEGRIWRRFLFDCVKESLDVKCRCYYQAGYSSWAKGEAILGMMELAEQLHQEITSWKGTGDWMTDELVYRDMSSHIGRWSGFETDAFEAGRAIARGVLSSLVDEVVADLLMVSQM